MTNTTKHTVNKSQEYDEDTGYNPNFLSYSERVHPLHNVTVSLDGPILGASYYRHIAEKLDSLSEHDTVKFKISSPGGDLNGLVTLLDAIHTTEALVIAHIVGECHSAASMFALNCPHILVSPLANMLVHFVSFGSGGKAQDIKNHVEHVTTYSEKIFRETYKYFLSDIEMQQVIEGKELWLQSDEIEERLVLRQEGYLKEKKKQEKLEKQSMKLAKELSKRVDDTIKETEEAQKAESQETVLEDLKQNLKPKNTTRKSKSSQENIVE